MLNWGEIRSRDEARVLQQFRCTSERPRTTGGRKLAHPKPWEWETQSWLRQASKNLKGGDLLVVGYDSQLLIAAAHLMFDIGHDIVQMYVAAAAAHVDVRGQGGLVANELMSVIHDVAIAKAREHATPTTRIACRIHTGNAPSQRLAVRVGLEPQSVPHGDYQDWCLDLEVPSQE